MTKGLFIAIEGGDGSGKATQTALLAKYYQEQGEKVFQIAFPQYGKPSAKIIENYLNGGYGEIGRSAPEFVSLAYAIDRHAAAKIINEKLANGIMVIADRYVASNLAHQAAGIDNIDKRKQFYELIKQIEYDVLDIPKPDINIVLLVPVATSTKLMEQRDNRTYTAKKRDIHEADAVHLENAKRNYIELCTLYPKEFAGIDCMYGGELDTIENIHQKIKVVLQRARSSA